MFSTLDIGRFAVSFERFIIKTPSFATWPSYTCRTVDWSTVNTLLLSQSLLAPSLTLSLRNQQQTFTEFVSSNYSRTTVICFVLMNLDPTPKLLQVVSNKSCWYLWEFVGLMPYHLLKHNVNVSLREKRRSQTQSYDNRPYTIRK